MTRKSVVVGIDLAGSEKRPTGFCAMDRKMSIRSSILLYIDEEIIERVGTAGPEVVSIDAPLGMPSGRKSLEDRRGPHLRKCDRALLKMGIRIFPLTLGPMRMLTSRGIRLKKTFEGMGSRVIEVYPGGAQDILKIPRKHEGLRVLREALERIGVKGMNEEMTGDELDAVTSALVGLMYLRGEYLALGDEDEGLMIIPKLK